jgi:hypothetical protein
MTIKNRAESKQKLLKDIIDRIKTENRNLVNEIAKKDELIKELNEILAN